MSRRHILAALVGLALALPAPAWASFSWTKKADNSAWSGKANVDCVSDATYLYCIDRTTTSATNAASRWASDGTLARFDGCSLASIDNPVYRLWGIIGSTLYCGAASSATGNVAIRVQTCSLPACSSWSSTYAPTWATGGRFGPYGRIASIGSLTAVWAATVANSGGHRAYDGTTVKVSESNGMIPDVSESAFVNSTLIVLGARRDNLDGYTEHGMSSAGSSLYSGHIQTHATTTGVGASSTSHLVASSATHVVFCMRGSSNTYCATVKVSDGTEAAWNAISGDVRTGIETGVLSGSTVVNLMKSDGTCYKGNATPPTSFTSDATCALTPDSSDNVRILAACPDWNSDGSADPCAVTSAGDLWLAVVSSGTASRPRPASAGAQALQMLRRLIP